LSKQNPYKNREIGSKGEYRTQLHLSESGIIPTAETMADPVSRGLSVKMAGAESGSAEGVVKSGTTSLDRKGKN
jgi:hypothetical protein